MKALTALLTFSRYLLATIIIVAAPAHPSFSQNSKIETEQIRQQGIRQISMWTRYAGQGKQHPDSTKVWTREYDKQGNLVKEIFYHPGDTSKRRIENIYKHDTTGYLIEFHSYSLGKLTDVTVSTKYDSSGNLIERIDSSRFKRKYMFDSRGNMIEVQVYDLKGIIMAKEISKFDPASRITEHIDLYGLKHVYHYDSQGNLSEKTIYSGNGNVNAIEAYSWDEQGKKISQKKFEGNRNKLIYVKNYLYDEKGKLVKEAIYYREDAEPDYNIYEYRFY